ncbi:MAG: 4-hydroxythreonine-4-phosphate dehydrogenase PdxA [Chthoniobacterales bacterium]
MPPQFRRIGITLGDPAGIGPEVVEGALQSGLLPTGFEYVLIGKKEGFHLGNPDKASAQAARDALEEAATLAVRGEIQAVVTGPVSKHPLHQVGFNFPGQTEFFAARAGVENYAMLLTGGQLTVALVTAHLPLRKVVDALSRWEIERVGSLLAEFLLLRKPHAKIAVAGLNPHAGEQGDLGSEEMDIIEPAVKTLCDQWQKRAEFSGPISPDTIFARAVKGEFDAVLCMYHDQGLIPLKLHAFEEGVNVTLGLPFVRTSPDHGTAFDIAGKGIAHASSMIAAIKLAAELVALRFPNA